MSDTSAESKPAISSFFRFFVEIISFSRIRLVLFFGVIALLVGSVVAYSSQRIVQQRALQEQLDKLDRFTADTLVEEVEAIRAQLGRAPTDEAELELLLSRPMPVVHDYGTATFIHYQPTGTDSFLLQYELWDTAKWVYDSTQPESGWVQHWK